MASSRIPGIGEAAQRTDPRFQPVVESSRVRMRINHFTTRRSRFFSVVSALMVVLLTYMGDHYASTSVFDPSG